MSAADEIRRTVDTGLCTGCGGCALLSSSVSMELDDLGYARPFIRGDVRDLSAKRFLEICPGRGFEAVRTSYHNAIFGPYVSVWQGVASDPAVRHRGSSAGVLTALALLRNELAGTVTVSLADPSHPTRTVTQNTRDKKTVKAAAGSRYAPASPVAQMTRDGTRGTFVGKPCDVVAAAAVDPRPVRLSFFCAGTPSQHATSALTRGLKTVTDLRYRGFGWPGSFRASDAQGSTVDVSYEESWSQALGPSIQSRCKVCIDGTGESADVAVADFWAADSRGYPDLSENEPNSFVIARTVRGHDLIEAAMVRGVVNLKPALLVDLHRVQPSQVLRRATIAGRLAGLRIAGGKVPRYSGYKLHEMMAAGPVASVRAAFGTYLRAKRGRLGDL